MRLEEDLKFYKYKGFYLACFLGLLTILSIFGIRKGMKNPQNQNSQVAVVATDTPAPEDANEYGELSDNFGGNELAVIDSPVPEESSTEAMNNENATLEPAKADAAITSSATNEPVAKKEKKDTEDAIDVLNTEDNNQGLTWPVSGDIVLNYSMDRTVFFKTLNQYKCNPAVLIAGKKGDDVQAACDCEITNIKRNKENGLTITAKAGEYTYIYGQLANPKVSKGDTIKEGAVIACLAKPTSFYKKEGTHLYFEVKKGTESVNPLLLLK